MKIFCIEYCFLITVSDIASLLCQFSLEGSLHCDFILNSKNL